MRLHPQYAGLEALHQRYKDRDLVVIGVPSNDFGAQEPGGAAAIAKFCQVRYGVTFPLWEKTKTIGADASLLYKLLAKGHGAPEVELSQVPDRPRWSGASRLPELHRARQQRATERHRRRPGSVAPGLAARRTSPGLTSRPALLRNPAQSLASCPTGSMV